MSLLLTGKTFTTMALQRQLSRHLFMSSSQADAIDGSASHAHVEVTVQYFEIHGNKCYDLLADRNEIFLRADAEDNMHVRGGREVTARSQVRMGA